MFVFFCFTSCFFFSLFPRLNVHAEHLYVFHCWGGTVNLALFYCKNLMTVWGQWMWGRTAKPQRQQSNNNANRFSKSPAEWSKFFACCHKSFSAESCLSKWNEASVGKLCCVLLAEWSCLTDRLHTNGGPRGDRRGVWVLHWHFVRRLCTVMRTICLHNKSILDKVASLKMIVCHNCWKISKYKKYKRNRYQLKLRKLQDENIWTQMKGN